jgi:hypothetical protein
MPAGGSDTLDIAKLQEDGKVPANASWATVTLSYEGRYGDLVAIAASYETEGRYGLQTPFNDTVASAWVGSEWFSSPLHNSIITVGNASNEPTTASLILHYNGGRDEYEVEQNLAPDEQIWLDVGKVIQNQIPDKKGRTIPLNVQSGSYSIYDRKNVIGATLFEGKLTVDRTFGHASYGCGYCCVPGDPVMVPSNFSVAVGDGWQNDVFATNQCTGQTSNVSYKVTPWTAANSSVTVDGTGWASGVSPGTSGVNGTILVPNLDVYKCPLQHVVVSNQGSVKPKITGPNTVWWFSGQNPSGYATSITLTSSGGNGTIWGVTAGSEKVNINATGNTVTVTSTGSAFSSSVGDIKITAQVNFQTSAPFAITSRTPSRLANPQSLHSCNSGFGYTNDISYNIQDQLLTDLPLAVVWNEQWTTALVDDNAPNDNWSLFGRPTENGSSGTILLDEITGVGVNSSPTPKPIPSCTGTPVKVQHWGQKFSIGSLIVGQGKAVQTDNLTRFNEHAEHQNRISPTN